MKYTLLIFSLISFRLFAKPFYYNTSGEQLDVNFEECINAQKDGFKILSIDEMPTYLNFYYHDDFLYKFQSHPRLIGEGTTATINLLFMCNKYKIK